MRIVNRNINREYTPQEKYEAGVALTGAEVKAVRAGRAQLEGAYVKIVETDVVLVGAQIQPYPFAKPENYDPQRTRKLLLHKKETLRLKTKLAAGGNLTIIPIAWYTKGSLIKLEIALSKGKKAWEVKRVDKERDEKRRIEKELKEEMR